jgi:two-component system OmpR family response regulator
MAPLILIVEDAPSIREPLARFFEANNFRVRTAGDVREADALLAAHAFELVIADIMLPGEDGLSLCRRIRAAGALPVILLTARAEEVDRIVGLEVGADDYVVKPFSPRELLARVKAVLRRAHSLPPRAASPNGRIFEFGPWTLKTVDRSLSGPDGVATPLSTGEYTLLLTFLERPNLVLTRDQLLDLTRGREAGPFDRSVDNQVSRLRRKIEIDPREPQFIKTVWGGGYMFCSEAGTP